MASPTKKTWIKRDKRDEKKLKVRHRKLRAQIRKKAKSASV